MKFSDLKLTTPYLQNEAIFYDVLDPRPLDNPFLISVSQDAAKLLGVDEDLLDDEKLLGIVNGSLKMEGSSPFAMCYAGHQFGHFVPRLGDGRVLNLGKVNGVNLQLKGSGITLYSRGGDGRAVLRSSIREYLMSEAMHGLGIKTSRALALIGSDTDVSRQTIEKGAIVLRLASTWIRFGSFEFFNAAREPKLLQDLADYALAESFPHLVGQEDSYLKMFAEIVKSTAKTIAYWMSVGFNHGVMNTDNMSIDGSTIDYGPFAFLDDYEAYYICNHTDTAGRYSFVSQKGIGYWNLEKLARALSPILNHEASMLVLENVYYEAYDDAYLKRMRARLGLFTEDPRDMILTNQLLSSMENSSIDFNLFFRRLSSYDGNKSLILDIAVSRAPLERWLDFYDARLLKEEASQEKRHSQMLGVNPKYILKNHILQLAIDKANENDFSMVNDLLKVALSPFEEHEDLEYLCINTPQDAKNIKLSCSS
ncbi:MAG: YdiU family protein [Sulfurimonas sp.]|nr:YdiU family protein [Sulfurimonas sp.]